MQIKKYRHKHQSFLVQGTKSIIELLRSDIRVEQLYISEKLEIELISKGLHEGVDYEVVSSGDIQKVSTLSTNGDGIAVAHIPDEENLTSDGDFVLVLDSINDPGNLGTIVRTADWYGIEKIVCSTSCVDFYNPKVISATMGSFARIKVMYKNLEEYFDNIKGEVVGTVLDGVSIYESDLPRSGYIVIGSESHGISEQITNYVSCPVTIPGRGGGESLNAGVAAGIVLDNIFRPNS